MDGIDKVSSLVSWNSDIGKSIPIRKEEPELISDRVDIGTSRRTISNLSSPFVNKTQPEAVSEKAKTREIMLEKIVTPLDAAVTPFGDTSLISTVGKAVMENKAMHAKGFIQQGEKRYDVELILRQNQDDGKGNIYGEKGYDYKLTGKLGNSKIDVHCYTSGLSLFLEGTMGENTVRIKNSYSILSGKVITKGTLGQVPVNLESKGNEVVNIKGELGGVEFNQKITQTNEGSITEGRLGEYPISGKSLKTGANKFTTSTRIADVTTQYDVSFS